MGAITRGKPGVGQAAVRALNAGVDIVLVSYMEKHFDPVMSALLAADQNNGLDGPMRSRNRDRITRIVTADSRQSAAPALGCVKIEGSAEACD